MRSVASLLVIAVCMATVVACGGSGKKERGRTATQAALDQAPSAAQGWGSELKGIRITKAMLTGGYVKDDGDGDQDDDNGRQRPGTTNDDVDLLAPYGGNVDRLDLKAVRAVVERYYRAAVAEDGATACGLLSPSLARALAREASAPSSDEGRACAQAASKLFSQQHAHLLSYDVAHMVVVSVHARNGLGLAILGFRSQPESEILVERARGSWKIGGLLDSELT
jgi:hypothetical protein